jgi:hypothetical protein
MPLEGKEAAFAALDGEISKKWEETARAFGDVCFGVILPESMDECPVDQGTLRASAPIVSKFTITPTEAVATLGYGGAASAYARRQHEDLSFRHTVGKAKFLEDPIMRNAPMVPEMVASRIGAMRGGK